MLFLSPTPLKSLPSLRLPIKPHDKQATHRACHAFEKPLPPAKNKRRAGSGPPPNGELWANKCGQCIGGIFHMQMEATPG